MSSTSIPDRAKLRLWIAAGGRCEYLGCNQRLFRDDLTLAKMNRAYIAHIVADSPNGPRGDQVLSAKLAKELSNLMLLCDTHHRLIDEEDVVGHPVELLTAFKKQHEDRIDRLTGIDIERKSYIVTYAVNIGTRKGEISPRQTRLALVSEQMYPATEATIDLDMTQNAATDNTPQFWVTECQNIDEFIRSRLSGLGPDGKKMEHLSVFAIAPIPLLVYFGKMLGDIRNVEVFQRHRDTKGWEWQPYAAGKHDYVVDAVRPATTSDTDVTLELSLSDNIDPEGIEAIMGSTTPIYRIAIPKPSRDHLKSKEQLVAFCEEYGRLLTRIKGDAGQGCTIHMFPAIPVSVAVEIGRAALLKSDVSIQVYDFNKTVGGWKQVLTV
jgi:hypothetical protein